MLIINKMTSRSELFEVEVQKDNRRGKSEREISKIFNRSKTAIQILLSKKRIPCKAEKISIQKEVIS